MEARAIVSEVVGDRAIVEVLESEGSGCGRCHEPGGCGGSLLNQAFAGKPQRYTVPNPPRAAVGERVILIVREGVALRAAAMGYLVPLAYIVGGTALGAALAAGEGAAPMAQIIGMLAGLGAAAVHLLRFQRGRAVAAPFAVSIDRIADDPVACDRLPPVGRS